MCPFLLLILLFVGGYNCKLDLHVGVDHDVHQREQQPTQDLLYEDGGCMAAVQPSLSLHCGSHPHLHGHSQE